MRPGSAQRTCSDGAQKETPRELQGLSVPFVDLKSEHKMLRESLLSVWEDALDKGAFIGGEAVENFEKAFADFCDVKHAIGVGNGTDALLLALKALSIGSGDEVILPANTFFATAEAVVHSRAKPVFVDVDPETYNIDVNRIEHHITPRTRAIIPVHLYGQPADMEPILEIAWLYDLKVIEDAAQAHGACYRNKKAGSLGDAACFSFYPAKNLGACGDGGAVVTNNRNVSDAVKRLRDHGGLKKYEHDVIGHNSRLDSLQAAVLQVKLQHLAKRNEMRRQHAQTYGELLRLISGVVTPFVPEGISSVYHLYVIRLEKGSRNGLQNYLQQHGVQTGIHYPTPVHRTQAFASYRAPSCPIAEAYADRILSLPMYADIEKYQVEYVAELVGDYMQAF